MSTPPARKALAFPLTLLAFLESHPRAFPIPGRRRTPVRSGWWPHRHAPVNRIVSACLASSETLPPVPEPQPAYAALPDTRWARGAYRLPKTLSHPTAGISPDRRLLTPASATDNAVRRVRIGGIVVQISTTRRELALQAADWPGSRFYGSLIIDRKPWSRSAVRDFAVCGGRFRR